MDRAISKLATRRARLIRADTMIRNVYRELSRENSEAAYAVLAVSTAIHSVLSEKRFVNVIPATEA